MVVEPDLEMRPIILEMLKDDGFEVTGAVDGESVLSLISHHRPDLVIMDLKLPCMQGLELVQRLQEKDHLPTIIVSARGSETDRVVGLEMGADDYVVKPFFPRELLARVHAVLRRSEHCVECETLRYDGCSIDLTTRIYNG